MNASARNAYLSSMVTTTSPQRLLVLLYDRLILDLQRAEESAKQGEHGAAAELLMHAQEIVLELRFSLREDVWDGAGRLASIYAFVHTQLIKANVDRDPDITHACRLLVEPLAEAWREASLAAAASA
jgi:flagellar protein FliS